MIEFFFKVKLKLESVFAVAYIEHILGFGFVFHMLGLCILIINN